jgi:hypothetical protein
VVVVVVVVDFLVTICPCPVLAAAAPASLSPVFFSSPQLYDGVYVYYSQVCKYVAAKESIGRRLSNGGSC